MPITAVTIENFKGIRDPIRIEFKPITLLFGPNSAGKSTIVQALHYALEIFDRNNLDPGTTSIGGHSVDLGGFETLIYNHDLSRQVRLKFELDLKNEDLPRYFEGFEDMGLDRYSEKEIWEIPSRAISAWVEISIKWNSQTGRPLLHQYNIGINDANLARIETSDDGKQVFLIGVHPTNPVFLEGISRKEAGKIITRMIEKSEIEAEELEKLGPIFPALIMKFNFETGFAGMTEPIGIEQQGSALPKWGIPLVFQGNIWAEETSPIDQGNFTMCLSSLIVGPGELIRDALRRLFYIGPIREIPSRSYLPEKSPDTSRWSSGAMGWDLLYRADDTFLEKVNRWLTHQDCLNAGYRVEVKKVRELDVGDPITLMLSEGAGLEDAEMIQSRFQNLPIKSRITIREEATGIELMPQDVGVGISQTLPVIVGALYIKEGILAVEQPELHIHPALQVAIGDLFISQIQEKALSFLLETHSEHLMLRLLRRIRETKEGSLPPGKWPLNPDQITVYYVAQSENGVTVNLLRVDEEGEFQDEWPKGFFEEREEELLY